MLIDAFLTYAHNFDNDILEGSIVGFNTRTEVYNLEMCGNGLGCIFGILLVFGAVIFLLWNEVRMGDSVPVACTIDYYACTIY